MNWTAIIETAIPHIFAFLTAIGVALIAVLGANYRQRQEFNRKDKERERVAREAAREKEKQKKINALESQKNLTVHQIQLFQRVLKHAIATKNGMGIRKDSGVFPILSEAKTYGFNDLSTAIEKTFDDFSNVSLDELIELCETKIEEKKSELMSLPSKP